MRKKYKCRLSATSLLIRVKDKVMRLELEPSVLSEFGLRGCAYTTDNADIQHAIEHCDRFRSGRRDEIWTDDVVEEILVMSEKDIPAGKSKAEIAKEYANGTLPKEILDKGIVVKRKGKAKKGE